MSADPRAGERLALRYARLALGAAFLSGIVSRFGLAMAVSFGPKEPLDYSVFSSSSAALLLALYPTPDA